MTKPIAQKRRIEVFRAGTFTAMDGRSYAFSEADVTAIAGAYDATTAPAPVVVGHPTHDDPAFGWASGFEVDDRGILVAELDNLAPSFVSAVTEGRYKKVSMKLFAPDAPNNPKPGTYYPRHIGFLGGAAPAVSGLAPVEFSDGDDEGTIEIALSGPAFTDYGLKDTARVFRSLREWIIDKFGIEDADKAVDKWYVDWIDDAAESDGPADNAFAAPSRPAVRREPPVTWSQPASTAKPQAPAFTSKEDDVSNSDLTAREQRLAARERALAETENAAFADALVGDGHVAAGSRDRLVALLGAIPADAEELSFADGGETRSVAPRQLLRDLLSSAPTALPDGQTDLGADPGVGARGPAFSAPDGYEVDADSMELFAKARAYHAENPNISFAEAAIAVQEKGA
ncbi:hypothetical protein AN189_13060 [Loktanella sp. 3ANDIMAR09]|uniref:hypothetical protein n=1 Tax=Loktanella sp. 3ANDIMAR09 TaxID=1225657 RepID=UPI00070724F5|nr:hypothetical protein [Loktanella sp. 3ANDIMAR09]KQI68026.1 hypothetical protein AN189_13060 [Loktanella sp. 3ANDIMAR09]